MKKYIVTACCESILLVNEAEINKDDLGLHISNCPHCNSSCNVEYAEDLLIPYGTRVKYGDVEGMIYENDLENTEEFSNINYGFISDENRNSESWHDDGELLLRGDFEILGR